MQYNNRGTLFLILACLLFSSCSIVPQNGYQEKVSAELQQVASWPREQGDEQLQNLNQLIYSKELDALIAEALAANPNLQQTALTLQIVAAEHRAITGAQLPEADLQIGASKEKSENGEKGENYSGAVSISWEVDLWGKLADSSKAAAMDEAEQRELYYSARNTLTAEVMKSWLTLITAQHDIDIEKGRLETLTLNQQYVLQRYRSGLGSLEDLDSARSTISVSLANIEAYEEILLENQRSLQIMIGRVSRSTVAIPADYPDINAPLAGEAKQTLRGRPDLRAAWFAIEAADLKTSVAYKDLLPSFSLEAALSDTSSLPESMLLSNPVWSLLGQLTAPLYKGGQLKAAADVAELETAKSYQAYRQTLLTAVGEVEDALSREHSLAKQIIHIDSALTDARNSLKRYKQKYRSGLVDIIELLEVQKQTFDLEIQLDNLVYERLTNRVDLGLALGLGVEI